MVKSMDGLWRSTRSDDQVRPELPERGDLVSRVRSAFNALLDWFVVY